MSVHKHRARWRSRWREGDRNLSRTFDRREDAEAFDAENRLRLQKGAHGPSAPSRETLDQWLGEWWDHASGTWATTTRKNREGTIAKWIIPYLGRVSLFHMGAYEIEAWRNDIIREGATPRASAVTANKALEILSTALSAAVKARRLPANPCAQVGKLRIPRKALRALTPEQVERVRLHLPTSRDRLLWSLLSLAGLRPEEALALRWSDVVDDHLIIERAVVDGEEKGTKTGGNRRVRIIGPLHDDLAAARVGSDQHGLVCPAHRGGFMDLRNWRSRVFMPAAAAAGLGPRTDGNGAVHRGTTPYAGRHAFISLMIAAGQSPMDVAFQAGHSNPGTTWDNYAHQFTTRDLRVSTDPGGEMARQRRRFSGPFVEPSVPQAFPASGRPHLRLVA